MPLVSRKRALGGAPATTLSADISASALVFTVPASGGTGYPTGSNGQFIIAFEIKTSKEEKVLCDSRAGDTFTIAAGGRGYDDTTAQAHTTGATVNHTIGAVIQNELYDFLTLPNAKGDLAVATAADNWQRKAAGADDAILMADAVESDGLKWANPAVPSTQAFGDAAAAGTADTYTRGDHKHAMPADPVTAHAAAGDPHSGYVLESLVDAKGDLIVASAADTVTRVAVGTNNQVLTADSAQATGVKWAAAAGGGGPTIVDKTVNENVTSSTAVQDDDHLFLAIAANEIWIFEMRIHFFGTTTNDFRLTLTGPTGAQIRWAIIPEYTNADALQISGQYSEGIERVLGCSTSERVVLAVGKIKNSVNAGDLRLRWAQGTSDAAATTVTSFSSLIAHKVS